MTAHTPHNPKFDDGALLNALRVTPEARKAVALHEQAIIEKRCKMAAEIDELDKKAARELPPLRAAVQTAVGEFEDARRRFQGSFDPAVRAEAQAAAIIAQEKAATAQVKSMTASFAYSGARDELEHQLRQGASPAIKLFISEMLDAHAATRRTPPATIQTGTRNLITGVMQDRVASNAPSVARRMRAILNASHEAEALALEPDQRNIEMKLEALRQALPAVGEPE